jgi:hypothetical protein
MQDALRTRAISFAAASGLCAMALIAMLGMKFHYSTSAPPDVLVPVDGYVEEPPAPLPPEPRPDQERQTLEHDWLDPLPIDNDALPQTARMPGRMPAANSLPMLVPVMMP